LKRARRFALVCIFTHIAAGALAGALAPAPVLAPLFGLGSHIALDVLPHYDFENIRLEILFGVIVFAVLIVGGARSLAILLGAAFAVLPDMENLLWKFGAITDQQKIFPGHVGLIPHGREAGIPNLLVQVVTSVVMVVYLLRGYA
jgi:hypothetical protein